MITDRSCVLEWVLYKNLKNEKLYITVSISSCTGHLVGITALLQAVLAKHYLAINSPLFLTQYFLSMNILLGSNYYQPKFLKNNVSSSHGHKT